MSIYEKVDFLSFFDVQASKWVQNDPQAQKQLHILKPHTFTFSMIYSKSINEKIVFLSFLMYELQNGFRITLKPKNNYRFLKHILLPFQLYIASQYMKK